MSRLFSPIILAASLFMISNCSVLSAQEPKKVDNDQGADLFQRGWKNDQGSGQKINIPEAIRLYREAALKGNSLAKARLAQIFYFGNGVPENKDEAARLSKGTFEDVRKTAEKNDPVAQMILSNMYGEGLGVGRDGQESRKWLRKAADLNLPGAQCNLAVCYENGIGVEKDQAEAARWYRKAGDQNYGTAMAYLGDMYRWGKGVERDEVKAAQWYYWAAQQNCAHGQTNLGYMYDHGCGVAQNSFEAVRLYRMAAEQNFAVGQFNLGNSYEKGCGVERNIAEAVKWYSKAAAQGYQPAIKALRCLGYEQW